MRAEATTAPDRMLLPTEVAARLRLPVRSVRALIRRGDIRAIDLAGGRPGRRRYRIAAEDLADFEVRMAVGTSPRVNVNRRRKCPGDYEHYFRE
jgi:excisionase family DNA binding protein